MHLQHVLEWNILLVFAPYFEMVRNIKDCPLCNIYRPFHMHKTHVWNSDCPLDNATYFKHKKMCSRTHFFSPSFGHAICKNTTNDPHCPNYSALVLTAYPSHTGSFAQSSFQIDSINSCRTSKKLLFWLKIEKIVYFLTLNPIKEK